MSREEFRDHVAEHWDEIVAAASDLPPAPPSATWLTRIELANRWKMPPATLDQWAYQGRGPRFAKFGRHARYRLDDVLRWESEQLGGGAVASPDPDPPRVTA